MFKKNRYQVVRNAIPIEVASFVHDYFLNKKQAGYRNHSDMESNNLNAILSFGGTGSETYQLFFN